MKIYNKVFLILAVIGLVSCDDYGQFKEELYEKMVYIVTTADYNEYPLVCDMNSEDSLYGLSIAISGTTEIGHDIRVTLAKDEEALLKYNVANFDSVQKYALELPELMFNIPSYSIDIKADNPRVYTLFPILIERENVYKLNPDSIYFIPLKIENTSGYTIKEDKNTALVRIYPKNKYAETLSTTYYNLTGTRTTVDGVESGIFKTNKVVTPLTNNEVRMNVGVVDSDTKRLVSIQSSSMIVTVDEDNKLSISPYAPEANLLEVELLDPPSEDFLYNNRFEELPNPYSSKKIYQRFLLYYKYRTWDINKKKWSEWLTVAESTSRDVYIE